MGHGHLYFNLFPNRFQESIFHPLTRLQIPALDFAERDKCKPVLLRLWLAGNLEKLLLLLWDRMEGAWLWTRKISNFYPPSFTGDKIYTINEVDRKMGCGAAEIHPIKKILKMKVQCIEDDKIFSCANHSDQYFDPLHFCIYKIFKTNMGWDAWSCICEQRRRSTNKSQILKFSDLK